MQQQKRDRGHHGQALVAPALLRERPRAGRWNGADQASLIGHSCTEVGLGFFPLQSYISQQILNILATRAHLLGILTPDHMFQILVWNTWSMTAGLLL